MRFDVLEPPEKLAWVTGKTLTVSTVTGLRTRRKNVPPALSAS